VALQDLNKDSVIIIIFSGVVVCVGFARFGFSLLFVASPRSYIPSNSCLRVRNREGVQVIRNVLLFSRCEVGPPVCATLPQSKDQSGRSNKKLG
jgi:hypothetical protein